MNCTKHRGYVVPMRTDGRRTFCAMCDMIEFEKELENELLLKRGRR